MFKNSIVTVEGYFLDNPAHIHYVNVHLGSWDGIENHSDNDIFYYMDAEPLKVGKAISDSFIVLSIDE